MTVNLITGEGQRREYENVTAAVYSEVDDLFKIDRDGQTVFSIRMGEINELEIYQ